MDFHQELHEAQRTRDCQRALNLLTRAEAVEDTLDTITDMIKTNHLDSKFCQQGACETLVALLLQNSNDAVVVWRVFRTMAWLCVINSEARKRLAVAGACELVLQAIEQHAGASTQVQDYGCFAVSSLANNSHDNKRRFQQCNAKQIIQQLCRPSDLKSTAITRI